MVGLADEVVFGWLLSHPKWNEDYAGWLARVARVDDKPEPKPEPIKPKPEPISPAWVAAEESFYIGRIFYNLVVSFAVYAFLCAIPFVGLVFVVLGPFALLVIPACVIADYNEGRRARKALRAASSS
jgi:hypothetical protein